jgi:hypothetical protein
MSDEGDNGNKVVITVQFNRPKRVWLEPDLERLAGDWPPDEKRLLAKRLYRWSKQLWVSADVEDPPPVHRRRGFYRSKPGRFVARAS